MGADRDASPPSDSDPGVSLRERLGSGLPFEMCNEGGKVGFICCRHRNGALGHGCAGARFGAGYVGGAGPVEWRITSLVSSARGRMISCFCQKTQIHISCHGNTPYWFETPERYHKAPGCCTSRLRILKPSETNVRPQQPSKKYRKPRRLHHD